MVGSEIFKTAIYIRVSTEDQATEGFSINAQKEKLTKYLEANDWKLYDIYIDDGISGKNIKDRPQMKRLIQDITDKKLNNVLVYKLDRLTRSLVDLMELLKLLEEHECSLNSQTEKLDTSNAVGRMFLKIIGTFAEFERENLSERVSFGYEQKTREGGYTNVNGVYGYNYLIGKGTLEVNEVESEIVKDIFNLFLSGKAMITIAKDFNKRKVPTKRGGDWSQSTIKSILSNPLYIGKIRYGVNRKLKNRAFTVDSTHEPIIEEDIFNKVQEQMSKRKKFNIRKFPSDKAYFGSVLKCSKCGAKMHSKMQKQNGKLYISYYCNNKQISRCDSSGISHIKVLNAFEEYIKNIKLDTSIDINNKYDYKKEANYIKELDTLEKKRKRIQRLFIDETISSNDYKDFMTDVNSQKETINNELELLRTEKEKQIDYNSIKDLITNMRLNWDYLNDEERYSFIFQFIDYIEIDVTNNQVQIKELRFS